MTDLPLKIFVLLVLTGFSVLPTKADAACTSPTATAGSLNWNTGAVQFQYCDGTAWQNFGGGGSTFAAGSVGAPGWAVTGNAATGFWAPAPNTLSISAGGVEIERWNTVASGVNYLSMTPGATGSAVTIAAAGSDTDINIALSPKGAGAVSVNGAPPTSLSVINSRVGSGNTIAVLGQISATGTSSGNTYAGYFENDALTGGKNRIPYGVYVTMPNTNGWGVYSNVPTGFAVSGFTGSGTAVYASAASAGGTALYGTAYFGGYALITDLGNVGIGSKAPVHALDVNGNIGLAASGYLNFGSTDGSAGYGIRDNAGVIECKSSSGSWGACGGGGLSDGTTVVGVTAASGNITGNAYTTAIGFLALNALTTGSNNTAVGAIALRYNTSGSNNTATGYLALSSNTTGNGNTASGTFALQSNITGTSNTGYGGNVLFSNTSGSFNTATGTGALQSNTTGFTNNANGVFALQSNTTGSWNSASGFDALFSNTTGYYNTALGTFAGYDITTGSRNIVLGAYPTNSVGITTGSNNIMMGYDVRPPSQTTDNQLNIGNLIYGTGLGSGATLSTGNVGIGTATPSQALDVYGNVVLSGTARRIMGDFSNGTHSSRTLFQTSTANSSSIVGIIPNGTATTGQLNIYNKSDLTAPVSTGQFSISSNAFSINSTVLNSGTQLPLTFNIAAVEKMRLDTSGNVGIGTATPAYMLDVAGTVRGNSANNGVIGTTGSTSASGVSGTGPSASGSLAYNGYGVNCLSGSCGGTAPWTNYSDARLKTKVVDLPLARGLLAIMKLRPVSFHWNDAQRDRKEGQRIGFIAQEIEPLYPELVSTNLQGIKSLSYAEIVVPLVKAVQDLKADNDNLRDQFETYKAAHP